MTEKRQTHKVNAPAFGEAQQRKLRIAAARRKNGTARQRFAQWRCCGGAGAASLPQSGLRPGLRRRRSRFVCDAAYGRPGWPALGGRPSVAERA